MHPILANNRAWKDLQGEHGKLARNRGKYLERWASWDRNGKEERAAWAAQVDAALLEGLEPPPEPEPKPQPPGNAWIFQAEGKRLEQREVALLQKVAYEIEEAATDRERTLLGDALPQIVALEKTAAELTQLCRMVERVRRAVEGAGAPVRVQREAVDLATLAEYARRSDSFLSVSAAGSTPRFGQHEKAL